jgi:hypothetical protein
VSITTKGVSLNPLQTGLGTPVFSTNKADRHDIAEILLKVALNTIKPSQKPNHCNS